MENLAENPWLLVYSRRATFKGATLLPGLFPSLFSVAVKKANFLKRSLFLCAAEANYSLYTKTSQSTWENVSWRAISWLLCSPGWNIRILSGNSTLQSSQAVNFSKIVRFWLGRTEAAKLNLNSQYPHFAGYIFSHIVSRETVYESSREEETTSYLCKQKMVPLCWLRHKWNTEFHGNGVSAWQRRETEIPLNVELIQYDLIIRHKET